MLAQVSSSSTAQFPVGLVALLFVGIVLVIFLIRRLRKPFNLKSYKEWRTSNPSNNDSVKSSPRTIVCPTCNGRGQIIYTGESGYRNCPMCKGNGSVLEGTRFCSVCNGHGVVGTGGICSRCKGRGCSACKFTGATCYQTCPTCKGEGVVR